jgi:type IV pilus assembly protein PilY1
MSTITHLLKKVSLALVTLSITVNAQGALTDIYNAPLITGASSPVQPNIFLMMDDSGSMGWDYMPDNNNSPFFNTNTYGYASNQCNGVYYDPNFTYAPPVDSTGASYPNATFTAAWQDGFNTGSGTTNLSSNFGLNGGGGNAAYYYNYKGTQNTEPLRNFYNSSSTFFKECGSTVGSTPGSAVFTKVTVSSTSGPGNTNELTNFANWYSYYRTRVNMMKTSTGLAFTYLTSNYRVGFATMNNNNGTDFVNLASFTPTQRAAWYAKLYGVSAGSSTPLLGALAKVGRMYANKLTTINTVAVNDPIQYSCQQNYVILSTDGFWNSQSGDVELNGTTAVGEQDGNESRPMYDGSTSTIVTTTPYTTVKTTTTNSSGNITIPWTQKMLVTANCSVAAVTVINQASTTFKDSGKTIGLAKASTDPSGGGYCQALGGSGSGTVWLCRSGTNPETGKAFAPTLVTSTDSKGTVWYLVSNVSGNTNCVADGTSTWGSGGGYSTSEGACGGSPAVTGSTVTTTTQTQNEIQTGISINTVNIQTATNQTTTQTTINGVVGPTSALSPTDASASYTLNSNTVTTTGTVTSDTCSGQNGLVTPCPNATGTWTSGTPKTAACTAPQLTAGTTYTTPTAGTPTGASNPSTTGYVSTAGTPTSVTTASTGTSNTLSDVAEYYYITDLRDSSLGNNLSNAPSFVGTDISANNVPSSGRDSASWQHMTTFTLGLGARGQMVFSPTYLTDTSGDFASVNGGLLASSTICTWEAVGSICNWPIPNVSGIPANIDDLWHAAVDGRGTYFSATNPNMLAMGLSTALAQVSARTGGAAAATTSNPNVTSGDNFVFSSSFESVNWTGQLIRQTLDLTSGAINPSPDWCADDVSIPGTTTATIPCPTPNNLLDTLAAQGQTSTTPGGGSRNIYIFNSAAANKLLQFTYANLGASQAYFNQPAITSLSQLCNGVSPCLPVWQASTAYTANSEYRVGMTWYHVNTTYTSGVAFGSTDTTNSSVVIGAAGTNLVNFLRGDRNNEGPSSDPTKYFRSRPLILGDIVNAEAAYAKAPLLSYSDPGYAAYQSGLSAGLGRQPMVYAAANDGMLHAFYASTDNMNTSGNVVASGGTAVTGGAEAWAYIPSMVLPNLYHLADKNYSSTHQFYVDGTPIIGDICTSNCTSVSTAVWKTILVGGLNSGGNGYYALDITNPAQPAALWEFTDTNMGLTYGNPQIAKVCDNAACTTETWAVIVTSGYNNVTTGDGDGHLYVINAATGALIRSISTNGVGSTTTPSGLAKIIAQTVNPGIDDTVLHVYGGDMLGNVWRFDVNNNVGTAGYDAQLLVTVHVPNQLQTNPATLTITPTAVVQPITEKPEVGVFSGNTLVFVGTGRYLGTSDLGNTNIETFYGIKDPLTGTAAGTAIYPTDPHLASSGFIQQVETNTTCPAGSPSTICLPGQIVRTSTSYTVDYSVDNGWFMDMPDSGERSYTDPTLQLGTLGFTSNVPSVSSCTVGGYSYSYFFDYTTGAPISSSSTDVVSVKLGNALATRPVYVRLPNGTIIELVRMSDGTTVTTNVPIGTGSAGTRRVSRRELITQ